MYNKHFLLLVVLFLTTPFTTSAEEIVYRFYSLPGDGHVRGVGTISQAYFGDYGVSASSTDEEITVSFAYDGTTSRIARAFLPFDTSVIPSHAQIVGATVNMWPSRDRINTIGNDTGAYIVVMGPSTQESTSTLTIADYPHGGPYGGANVSELSGRIWYQAEVSTTSFATFDLIAGGLNTIKKGGITMLAIRDGHENQGGAPSGENTTFFYSSEGPIDRRPYLEVRVQLDPTTPKDVQVNGEKNPPRVATDTPIFSAIFQSGTSTALGMYYEIQVASTSDWSSLYWDSGKQPLASTTPVNMRILDITTPQIFTQDGTTYFWRIKFWDDTNTEGGWSQSGDHFTMAIPESPSVHLLAKQDIGVNFSMAFGGDGVIFLQQTIDCRVVQGNITDITLRGQGNGGPGPLNVYLIDNFGHTSDSYAWPKWPAPVEKHTFHFTTPISCETGIVKFSVKGSGPQAVYFDGTENDLFPWGECIGACRDAKDLYFEIFGTSTATTINNAPLLNSIGNRTVNEGQLIEFAVNATDADGDVLTYSASNLPAGASFNVSTGIFSWTPSYNQGGNYADIEFTVMDNGDPMELDTELIMISVGNVNRPPVFAGVGNQEALEGETISFVVSATDPDGDAVGLVASGTPAGASFDANTGLFTWTPTLAQAGAYVVQFIATDNGTPNLAALLEVPLTVGDNPTPTEQAVAVVDVVVDYNFPLNVENSYLANLKKVAKFIEEGKIAAARNQLLAFIDKVESDMAGGTIGQTEGSELLVLANALLDDLQ